MLFTQPFFLKSLIDVDKFPKNEKFHPPTTHICSLNSFRESPIIHHLVAKPFNDLEFKHAILQCNNYSTINLTTFFYYKHHNYSLALEKRSHLKYIKAHASLHKVQLTSLDQRPRSTIIEQMNRPS